MVKLRGVSIYVLSALMFCIVKEKCFHASYCSKVPLNVLIDADESSSFKRF